MNRDRETLLQYLDGTLSATEVEALEKRLRVEGDLIDELGRLRSIQEAVSAGRAEAFGPFFVDRTLKAIRPRDVGLPAPSLYDALRWVFLRTAVAGLAIVVILGVLNMLDYQGLDVASNWFDAVFGLPSTTVQDAFSYGII